MDSKWFPELVAGHMTLRPLTEADLPQLLEWRNRDSIRSSFIDNRLLSWDTHMKFWRGYLARTDDLMWVICWRGTPCGAVALVNIDMVERRAEYGRLMIPDRAAMEQDRDEIKAAGGAAHIVNEMVIGYAKHIGIKTVYGTILPENASAIKNVRNSGFDIVGERDGLIIVERYL